MLALTFERSIPAFAIVRAAGGRADVATSALSMLHLGDVPEPELPARDWVRVLPTLSVPSTRMRVTRGIEHTDFNPASANRRTTGD